MDGTWTKQLKIKTIVGARRTPALDPRGMGVDMFCTLQSADWAAEEMTGRLSVIVARYHVPVLDS
jgi:hypothetical protein